MQRQGNRDFGKLLSNILDVFKEIHSEDIYIIEFYKERIERRFLEMTKYFCERNFDEIFQNGYSIENIKKANEILAEENYRFERYLHSSTYELAKATCLSALMKNRINIFKSIFNQLIVKQNHNYLKILYQSISGNPDIHKWFLIQVESEILEEIRKYLKNERPDPDLYVSIIVNFKTKYTNMIRLAFENRKEYFEALENSCKKILNSNPSIATNIIILFCDTHLKKTSKKESNQEVPLKNALMILKYLDVPEEFEDLYRQSLSKRLILNHSLGVEIESTFISKLSKVSKKNFTISKKMIENITSSVSLNNDFAQFILESDESLSLTYEIRLLNSLIWPIENTKDDCLLPGDVGKFHEHNCLVRDFKSAVENVRADDMKVIIKADKKPTNEHERRFNAPMTPEVAAVIVGAVTLKKVSCMDFYAYRIMIRAQESNHILKCRQLFQQFIVDMYAKVESERLNYIRFNQSKLRADQYIHLRDAIANDGAAAAANIGQMVILPASYAGSPRHMHEYAQDAMTYVRTYGRPDLFLTFTCNPAWAEIKNLLLPGQQSSHRHDLTARVFKQKLKCFIDLIVKNHIYGPTRCWMYSIEWQKRGTPHAHILIWLEEKILPTQIDNIISAELPDPQEDPELYQIIKKYMIHGPCGAQNPHSPCIKDGKCTKKYPRDLVHDTQTGGDGYPLYRRRKPEDGGHTATIKLNHVDFEVDNRWIVPYSPLLSKAFDAHINVEFCNSVKSIKYICKYVNKGSDMAVFGLQNPNAPVNEIDQFQMGRYISSNEAVWRILGFDIHERSPAVVHLSVHLENGQRVYFTEESAAQRAENPPNTTLTAFFQLCASDTFAATLLYHQVPTYYTWNQSTKKWQRRKKGLLHSSMVQVFSTGALGRVYTVHPSNAECYYLRMLLHVVKGPKSFEAIKTVNGQICQTYREACFKLGLLENDQHWDNTLAEASETCHPKQIRTLFAIILTTCSPSDPKGLWEKHKESMSEDILRRVRSANPNAQNSDEIFNEALISLEDICLSINNKILNQLGLISPERGRNDAVDRDMLREMQYDADTLQVYVETQKRLLTNEQNLAYNTVTEHVRTGNGGLLFLDAPGGTGKTFLLNLILAEIRMKHEIALAVASSGIAATLLDGGRTAHSAFKLPLNLNIADVPLCNIGKTSGMATVLKTCQIIIWDECTMAHKKALEALDRTLRDFRGNQRLMGGALILLAGDFRQILPVIPRATPADELNACLKNSALWRHVKKITLSTNMRAHLHGDVSAQTFAKQLLNMGDGKIPVDPATHEISFPPNFCQLQASIGDLEKVVFPDIATNFKNHNWLCERAILAPKNDDVNRINHKIQLKIPGAVTQYKSIDTVTEEDQAVNYPVEFLNSLEPPGMPPHVLSLKVGLPILLLRNLNTPKLCNRTRLSVKRLMPNVIETTIISGKCKGEDVLIPRIPMIPTDLPFTFKRLQFPVRLAFAMTINKSHGQSLRVDADVPLCNIGKTSGMATVLKTCQIIIWDECTMAHKKALEALDRTLRDFRGNQRLMGGALILLAGDFRQILPVIPRATPADELNACLKNSALWRHVKKITLSTNMRAHLHGDVSAQTFAKQLLNMGDGKIPVDPATHEISFPPNFCQLQASIGDLEKVVFPDIATNFKNHNWLCERAILAPKNDDVNRINHKIQLKIPGAVTQYKSIDTVTEEDQAVNYPVEFLNSLEPPGMPPHVLSLKVGLPILLLRNLNTPKLCNRTRLSVKRLMPNVIETTIISGKCKGEDVLIPRIPMIPTDLPFTFKRLQFPVRLAFAMTINKSHGQSLRVDGLHLGNPCFSHGQLYVACSRVGTPKNLYIYAPNERTKNI
ncbi:hypothetical protein LAZ67_6001521, partial [Cordylochernes scorpioides]